MLRGKYKKYDILYIYTFKNSHSVLRTLKDEDLIGVWEEDGINILFFHKPKEGLIKELIERYRLELESKEIISYEHWNEKKVPKPLRIGPFTIAPVWCEGKWDLIFDPSVVFGGGTHPTTFMLLELGWEFCQNFGIPNKVLDIGCGTGILSLFWAKLGSNIIAVDINPLCIEVTKNNLALNNLSGKVIEGDIKKLLPIKVDLILANLYKGLLEELFELPSFWCGKYYLISGFLCEMEEEILRKLKIINKKIIQRKESENWVCLLIKNF